MGGWVGGKLEAGEESARIEIFETNAVEKYYFVLLIISLINHVN